MKKKKYLVTGGSGFIGSALVRRLVEEGNEVHVLDNHSRGTKDHLEDVADKVHIVSADIRDADSVRKACKGMDSVFHLAFVNGTEFFYTKPDLVLDVGVKGMVNVLDACIKEEIGELILASSSEVYQTPQTVPTDETAPFSVPDPLNPRYSYAGGKIISELMAINYGRKYFDRVLIFRPHNVYGPDMGWEHVIPQFVLRMKDIVSRSKGPSIQFPIKGTGQETRAFVFIEDFADGLMVMKNKGEHLGIYHIGTDEEITIRDVAVEVGKYFKKKVDVVPGRSVEGGTPRRCPDISKMRRLGYVPKFAFTDGVAVTACWYDEHASRAPQKTEA